MQSLRTQGCFYMFHSWASIWFYLLWNILISFSSPDLSTQFLFATSSIKPSDTTPTHLMTFLNFCNLFLPSSASNDHFVLFVCSLITEDLSGGCDQAHFSLHPFGVGCFRFENWVGYQERDREEVGVREYYKITRGKIKFTEPHGKLVSVASLCSGKQNFSLIVPQFYRVCATLTWQWNLAIL